MTRPEFPDWLTICNLKARYCRLLDTKDWQGWGELFTEDCLLDTSEAGGMTVQGRDRIVASVRDVILDARTAHQVHSPEIEIDGDRASAIWAMQDRVVWNDRGFTGYGHYREDYLRCDDGAWRICALKLTRLCVDRD